MHPGELITPTLRLVEQLGVGGMGSVWIADHLTLHSRVAVKFMARELALNEDVRQRFSREAAAASQVKSPHVVQMFDHGVTSEGVPFIAMELLEGEDLAHRSRRMGGRLPPPMVADIILQAGKALSKAHERGIVHRDIKPENIFLCDQGEGELFVKVLDFGIAKFHDSVSQSTKTGSVMGTAYYMSPEQIVGSKSVDHRTDVWALGVVVFELLTGARPFDGETIGALALAIHAQALPHPTSLNPSLPPQIDGWFARACARDVAQRYQTVKEMTRDLAAILGQPPRISSEASGAVPSMQLARTASDPSYHGPAPQVAPSQMATPMPMPMPMAPFSTTTAGQSAGYPAMVPPQRSRAPLFVVLALLVAGGLGAAVFFLRSTSSPPTPPTTVQANDEPTSQRPPKKEAELAPAPTPSVEVSSQPTSTASTTTTTTKKKTASPASTPTAAKTAGSAHPSSTPTGAKTNTTTTSTGPSEPPIF